MSGFVRQSKFRHVFGSSTRKDGCYEGFRVTNCAYEGNFIAANKHFIAVCIETGGGGAFIVIPVGNTGRLDVNLPKVSAHREYILDIQWNPYNDNMLATSSEDGTIKLWEIPERGLFMNIDDSKALLVLEYHERRCTQVSWHPVASNVLMSVSQEPKICVWNLDDGEAVVEIDDHPDIIYNASWSLKGDKIVTSCKDKNIRIFDARSGDLLVKGNGHEGAKPQRVIFTFDDKYLFTCGFSKMSERQYAVWNAETLQQLGLEELDTANGCLIPTYDHDTKLIFLSAKGDSVVRYYEVVEEEPYFFYLSTFQSNAPQRGFAFIPKRCVDVNHNEIVKGYKLHGTKTGYIEPIPFTVPRKSEKFQEDLYPDAIGSEAALEASEWFEGKNAEPKRISMSQFFKGKAKGGASTGGGLKKGGLKGLKAKKEAKAASKEEPPKSAPAPAKEEPKKEVPAKKDSPVPEKKVSPSPTPSASFSGVDQKVVKELKDEIKSLKDNEKKMQRELKGLKDQLKDYDKLTADIKLLCDAVKKNDERIAALEALVSEESDEEEKEE